MSKHTPAPWRIVEGSESGHCCFKFSIVADQPNDGEVESVVICEVLHELFTCDPKPDFGYANARLIAAAPDLLEALEDLLDEQNGAPLLKRAQHWEDSVNKARAAIAKATGGSDAE